MTATPITILAIPSDYEILQTPGVQTSTPPQDRHVHPLSASARPAGEHQDDTEVEDRQVLSDVCDCYFGWTRECHADTTLNIRMMQFTKKKSENLPRCRVPI